MRTSVNTRQSVRADPIRDSPSSPSFGGDPRRRRGHNESRTSHLRPRPEPPSLIPTDLLNECTNSSSECHCPRGGHLMWPAGRAPVRGGPGGRPRGRAFVIRTQGGGYHNIGGGVSHLPLHVRAVVVRVFRPRPADPNRASGAGRDGSDPPFFAAGAVRRGEGYHTGSHTRYHTPPPPSGGSLPSPCIPAGRLPGPHAGRTISRDERPHA